MKTETDYIAEIKKLRQKHTRLFEQKKWNEMQIVRVKIITTWGNISRLKKTK